MYGNYAEPNVLYTQQNIWSLEKKFISKDYKQFVEEGSEAAIEIYGKIVSEGEMLYRQSYIYVNVPNTTEYYPDDKWSAGTFYAATHIWDFKNNDDDWKKFFDENFFWGHSSSIDVTDLLTELLKKR